MNTQARFLSRAHNPDVLSCIANLSSDEIFTPPDVANRMLDEIEATWLSETGSNIWANPELTFLDPCSKSGVYLREITRRLVEGLADEIPDLSERVNHILTKQVFGLPTTLLTSLVSRRTLYCSKDAKGVHSIASNFDRTWGNLWFERTDHSWKGGRCSFCGANQKIFDRPKEMENHAYSFLHHEDPRKFLHDRFGGHMEFDVVIGNPPYQLDTGGSGRQATPLYNLFVEQAKMLNPRLISMIIQSRWYGGGMGLSDFREEMLNDRRIRKIVDFTDSGEVFPGTDFGGGVCYFLWDRAYNGDCEVENHHAGQTWKAKRELNEFSYFVRLSPAVPIVRKVLESGRPSLREIVSSVRPFGIPTKERPRTSGSYHLISSGGTGPIPKSLVSAGFELVDCWKVLLSKTSHDHAGLPDKEGKRRVFSRLEVIGPGVVCTESYIVVGGFSTELEAQNCRDYLSTKFVRFLVSLLSYSQDITAPRFDFVPSIDFTDSWDDASLFKLFSLSSEDVELIESIIRPMGLDDAD